MQFCLTATHWFLFLRILVFLVVHVYLFTSSHHGSLSQVSLNRLFSNPLILSPEHDDVDKYAKRRVKGN